MYLDSTELKVLELFKETQSDWTECDNPYLTTNCIWETCINNNFDIFQPQLLTVLFSLCDKKYLVLSEKYDFFTFKLNK